LSEAKLFIHGRECRDCINVRDLLAARRVAFTELDMERTPGALQELVEVTGSATHVPVLVLDGKVFIQFDDESVNRIIELASGK